MKNSYWIVSFLICGLACAQPNSKIQRAVGGPCEDCDLMFAGMPSQLSWKAQLIREEELGQPLIISGTIYQVDGKTPARDVILYVYQTDNKGLYSSLPSQKHALRHGRLRGWMKTDERGRYEFKTIRPASYPDSNNPQHIHPIVKEPGLTEYWIDEFVFEDDPLLTQKARESLPNRGGSGIVRLTKNDQGVWIGTHDIVLGLHVTGY